MNESESHKIIKVIIIFFTLIFAILAIIACLGTYYGIYFQSFAFFGLFQPIISISNILLLIYWVFKKNKWAFIPLFALILNIEYLSSVFQFPKLSKNEITVEDSHFRICTYNIKGLNYGLISLTTSMISEFMKDKKVDILCLQEFEFDSKFNIDSISRSFDYLPYKSVIVGDKSGLGLAILSKYKILRSTRIHFGKEGIHAMSTDLLINGDTVRLFSFHLQTTNLNQTKFYVRPGNMIWDFAGEMQKSMTVYESLIHNFQKRIIQADFLRSKINVTPYPTIVCGDMNSNPSSYTYHLVKGRLKDGFKTCGTGYEYTYNGLFKLYRIDYIFHSDEFQGIEYKSYNLNFSDHRPVILEVILPKNK
jgi:endonuclease/exonuclease/phosphatase family metal-dependent hydrolase